MKGYKINRLTLAVALILSSGAASAAPENITYHGNTSGSIINFGPVPVINDADMDQKNGELILDTWWWNYQYSGGFKEAIAQLGLTIDQMTANYQEMDARAKNPNDPLFWLKRTLEIYPAQQNQYHIPVTEKMSGRTTGHGRNTYFLTRTYGRQNDTIAIETGNIPEGVACYAANDAAINFSKITGPADVQPLEANRINHYKVLQDGLIVLSCQERDNQSMAHVDQNVTMKILSGGAAQPLFIFGQHTQHEWAAFSTQPTPSGQTIFFDGRTRYIANNKLAAASSGTDILHTMHEHLLRTLTFDKLNGLDGASALHQPSRGLFYASYNACCWANGGHGLTAIGFKATIPAESSWGEWHEYGHHYQMGWSWSGMTEITVNLYSLAACYRQLGNVDVKECSSSKGLTGFSWDQQAVGSLLKSGQSWNFETEPDQFRRATMFAELMTSYPEMYPQLGKAYRESFSYDKDKALINDKQEKIDWFVTNASRFSGHDLRAFFDLWTLPYSAAAGEQIAALKLPQPAQPVATYEATLAHTGSTPTTAKLKIENNTDRKGIGFVANSEKVGPRALIWSGENESRLHTQVVDVQNRAFTVTLRGKRAMGGCSGHAVNTAAVCGSSDAGIHLSVSYHPEDNPHLPAGDYHGTLPLIATAWGNPAWTANVNIPLSISK
ncbi:hypothetical protein JK232_16210 [Nissabacter archeti]|uniref:Peptidase M60 domain-containing protein n=1 Tax=Nissabacter archeti TaxID=1917880 RepID=A0ABS5JKE9_9GAMM|nr:M60 family metallopeptidase [Nissabacter archeti]MBS0970435.1 hypothetical protein [Nissabacter archeti]